jgi:hypothetical protein
VSRITGGRRVGGKGMAKRATEMEEEDSPPGSGGWTLPAYAIAAAKISEHIHVQLFQ